MVAAKKTNRAPLPKGDSSVNPKHYKITLKNELGQTFECQAVDIIEALYPDDAHMGHAMTYILRAGKKSSSSYIEDIAKCAWWCVRAVNFRGGFRDIPKGNLQGD